MSINLFTLVSLIKVYKIFNKTIFLLIDLNWKKPYIFKQPRGSHHSKKIIVTNKNIINKMVGIEPKNSSKSLGEIHGTR